MARKRIMVIGPDGSGKTTLTNFLNNYTKPITRIQDVIYGKNTIAIPSSYIESPWMHKHIITLSQDASYVIFLIDQSNPKKVYPPGFGKVFPCPTIGVISKADLASNKKDKAIEYLREAGVREPYYEISIPRKIGIDPLCECLSLKID